MDNRYNQGFSSSGRPEGASVSRFGFGFGPGPGGPPPGPPPGGPGGYGPPPGGPWGPPPGPPRGPWGPRPPRPGGCCLGPGCYVATCVYQSYDCPQVWVLRRYRDNHLARSAFGRAFIRFYYRVSPTAVRLFGKTKIFHRIFRPFLDRKVAQLKAEGYLDTPYKDQDIRL